MGSMGMCVSALVLTVQGVACHADFHDVNAGRRRPRSAHFLFRHQFKQKALFGRRLHALEPVLVMIGVYTKKPLDDVIDTSEGALPLKLQDAAEDELGETPRRRRRSLAKLGQLLSEESENLNARKDTAFLLRFLRVRKYDIQAALNTIKNYYRNRITSGSVYRDFLPSKVSPATRRIMMVMTEKDVHGRLIFLFKIGSWDLAETSFVEMHRAVMICLEYLAKDPITQTLGMIMLFDYAGLAAENVLAIEVGLIKRGFEYLQDCMPMRMKGMYAVRQGMAFDLVYALVRPFLKKKLLERFRPYGENFEELHKEIPSCALPEEYGGTAPPLDFDGFWAMLETHDDEYLEDNSYGFVNTSDLDFATQEEIENEATFL